MAIKFGIELSSDVESRHVKILFWGATATRKTETVLRNFPNVLLCDAEGNSDQCVNMPEIPKFLRAQTKDPRRIVEILDAVSQGEIKFPDGSPVETFCIDSISVLWNVQKEVASTLAENRAKRYGKPADEALASMADWGLAKRPLKQIYTRFANSPIKYLVLIGREKELIEEENGKFKKNGFIVDGMSGVEYEMNLALRFIMNNSHWKGEVIKVQGRLKDIFPLGKKLNQFPAEELFAYAENIKPGETGEEDEVELGRKQAEKAVKKPVDKTQPNLLKTAYTNWKLNKNEVAEALKSNGVKEFNPDEWDDYLDFIAAYVSRREISPNGKK